ILQNTGYLNSLLFGLGIIGRIDSQTIWLAVSDNGAPSLANAERMVTDINFTRSVKKTFLLTIAVVTVQIALELAMGTMVDKVGRG
ncbi:sugar ABC transporter permease, partial [Rhizobium leguminosarum]